MVFNPLDCGKTKAQIDLDAADKLLADKKKALKDAIASGLPDTDISAAIDEFKSAGEDQLKKLNATIPKIPKIPNFQKDIDGLIGKAKDFNPTILKDISSLESSWGGIIDPEKLSGLVDKIKNPLSLIKNPINFCDEVDNQDAEIETDAEGNVTLKEKQTPPVVKSDGTPPVQSPVDPPVAQIAPTVQKGETTFTIDQYKKAVKHIRNQQKKTFKIIDDLIAEAEREGAVVGRGGTESLKELKNGIPKGYKRQHPDATMYDYYCGPQNNTAPGSSWPGNYINKIILKHSKVAAYSDMRKAIAGFNVRIINTLNNNPTLNGEPRWENGKWNPEYETELRKALYFDQGFGIRQYHPTYGFGLRKYFNTYETANRVQCAFQFKIDSYQATFAPRYQSGADVYNGTIREPDTQLQNLLKDYVDNIFGEEIGKGIFNIDPAFNLGQNYKYAPKVLASYTQNIDYDELDDLPSGLDFLPTSLGGNLPHWEKELLGTVTDSEVSNVALYNEETFEPHFMYRATADRTNVISQYAQTFEEHVTLANLGYVHNTRGF